MLRNPFRPSFGTTPIVVAGREAVVAQVGIALQEGPGSPYRFTLISGARGAGKTVLLNLIEDEATRLGWHVVRIPASRDMLADLRDTELPLLLKQLGEKDQRTITAASIAGVGSVSTEVTPEHSPTPSLRRLLRRACELAEQSGSGVFLTMDELQSARPEDLHTLTDAIQNIVRDSLPIALSVAGLPFEIAELLALPGTTFLRRSVPIELDPIADDDVARTFQETAAEGGRKFSPAAIQAAVDVTSGYAYLIQLIGSISFTLADTTTISESDLERSMPLVNERMGLQVHQPALRALPEREEGYLHAMVEIGTPARTSEIAERMGIPANQQTTYRRRLIERGLIRATGHGFVDFALPFLGDYLSTRA